MVNQPVNIIAIHDKIQQIKGLFSLLEQDTEQFPAINRNSARALASLKMMELNVSDLVDFDLLDIPG